MNAHTVTQQDVEELIAWMQMHLPSFEVCYKDESRFQAFLGRILTPVNPSYMTHYTTVMFGKVYFPSRQKVQEWGWEQMYTTLRHEFVHLMDAKRFPLWFEFSYLFCLPFVWTMRAFWELRGYTQDMLVEYELTGDVSEQTCTWIVEHFVRSDYGWMLPFPRLVRHLVLNIRKQIVEGTLQGRYPYASLKDV